MQPTLSHMSIANTRLLGTVREAVLPPLLDAFADVFDGLREPLLLQADAMEQDRAAFIDATWSLQQWDMGGFQVNASTPEHSASRFVELTMVVGRAGQLRR